MNVSAKRCGGGYGAKLGRSALVATACAVAANNRKAPVRMVMPLETNMEAVGKRFPMYAKYEVGKYLDIRDHYVYNRGYHIRVIINILTLYLSSQYW